jgi:hypothetical protein
MTEETHSTDTPSATPDADTAAVELDYPIQRGKQTISTVTLRKPRSGALRGLSLTDILQMNVTALGKLLPRITEPSLTEAEIRNLDPADLMQLGTTLSEFFLPKRMRSELPD